MDSEARTFRSLDSPFRIPPKSVEVQATNLEVPLEADVSAEEMKRSMEIQEKKP